MWKRHLWESVVLSVLSSCTFDSSSRNVVLSDAHVAILVDADFNAPDADLSVQGADASVVDASSSTPDAQPMMDAQAVSADGSVSVSCAAALCSSTEECCFQNPAPTCVPLGSCGGIAATCDGPEDCQGQRCCGGATGLSCQPSCAQQQRELCSMDSDCSTGTDLCCPVSFGAVSFGICAAQCGGGGNSP